MCSSSIFVFVWHWKHENTLKSAGWLWQSVHLDHFVWCFPEKIGNLCTKLAGDHAAVVWHVWQAFGYTCTAWFGFAAVL